MNELTRKEALDLLPLIVDNEASEEEKTAFYRYIQKDEDIRKKYESLLFVKQLLKTKYTPKKAPEHLKQNISNLIEDLKWEKQESSVVDNTLSSLPEKSESSHELRGKGNRPEGVRITKAARYVAAAAVILVFSLITIELLEKTSTIQGSEGIEELALSHFYSGEHISASIASYRPASIEHAAQILNDEMSHQLQVPNIDGATLQRVMYTTFSNGYTTPAFEFYQAGIDETVHVFAFRIDDLKKEFGMKRDPEAVKLCKTRDDYHVKEINGKHVVSWKWGDYWYTAVSNHNGDDLISLVEPVHID